VVADYSDLLSGEMEVRHLAGVLSFRIIGIQLRLPIHFALPRLRGPHQSARANNASRREDVGNISMVAR